MDEKAVVDTNILIALYNESRFESDFRELNLRCRILFSVVTVNELIRGALDKTSQGIVESLLEIKRGEFLTPSERQWLECARISEKILQDKRRSKEGILLLQNDLLIALSARDSDALLVTCDKKDFTLLKNYVKVPVEFW